MKWQLWNLKPPDWKKVRILGILLVAGLLLLTLRFPGGAPTVSGTLSHPPLAASAAVNPGQGAASVATAAGSDAIAAEQSAFDAQLAAILGRIAGAGQVYVDVSLAGGQVRRYARDTTTSRSSTTEKDASTNRTTTQESVQDQVVLAHDGSSGGDAPVTAQLLRPEVRGVLVLATGAGSPAVRSEIAQAAAAAAGVPAFRVVVLPAKGA